jgi:hypothetical protein
MVDEEEVNVLEDNRFLPSPSFLPMDMMSSDLFGVVAEDQKINNNTANQINSNSPNGSYLQESVQNPPTVTPSHNDGLLPFIDDCCPESTSRESCDDSQCSAGKSSPNSESVQPPVTGSVWVSPRPALHGQNDDLMLSDWIQQYVSYLDMNNSSENSASGQSICFPDIIAITDNESPEQVPSAEDFFSGDLTRNRAYEFPLDSPVSRKRSFHDIELQEAPGANSISNIRSSKTNRWSKRIHHQQPEELTDGQIRFRESMKRETAEQRNQRRLRDAARHRIAYAKKKSEQALQALLQKEEPPIQRRTNKLDHLEGIQ